MSALTIAIIIGFTLQGVVNFFTFRLLGRLKDELDCIVNLTDASALLDNSGNEIFARGSMRTTRWFEPGEAE